MGKVIDTCQSRLLSWSLSSSQLIQTAKEASAPPPRTCPNHPNGCPKPGSLVQPQAAAAATQPVAAKVSAQVSAAQPQGSSAQPQTSAAAAQPSAAVRGVSKQAAQPKAAVAGATATSTEHLQSAADRQKQLDDKYAAISAQQAVVQPGTPPPAASSSKDDGGLALAHFPDTECCPVVLSSLYTCTANLPGHNCVPLISVAATVLRITLGTEMETMCGCRSLCCHHLEKEYVRSNAFLYRYN